ncbi:ATP-dependent DNA helicase II subunit 2 [Ascosphaera acerosa]|nr:ATP-dependent DNA helicase II subunit 2 [Ascosphaera acerosa]
MADKEATVYILDLGRSMGEKRHGRDVSDLDYAMQYVWDKITYAGLQVSTERKTLNIGVVGFKTEGTNNPMYKQTREEIYKHVSVLQDLQQTLLPDVRNLKRKIKASTTDVGDAISALIVAIAMIEEKCKKLKYIRRIVLITNGLSPMETDDLEPIINKMLSEGIELTVLGVDFDDPEYGVKEEDKPPLKARNEKTFRSLAERCNGVCGTLEEAVTELAIPRPKQAPRPLNSFKGGNLMLGHYQLFDTAITIAVERYFRTYEARAPTSSAFVAAPAMPLGDGTPRQHGARGETEEAEGAQRLAAIRHTRDYEVTDKDAPGGKRVVTREQLAMGYEYGRTAVPISKEDEHITTLETAIGLEIMGFIAQTNVSARDHPLPSCPPSGATISDTAQFDRYMSMSNSQMIVGSKLSEADTLALSSIIRSLDELGCYAIARLVPKDMKPPVVVVLAPYIEEDFECLTEVQLPFAEDIRTHRFPPLDKMVSVSGEEVHEHRSLASRDLLASMEEFVGAMELRAQDDEGNTVELLPIDEYFSPVIHRIQQAIRLRAVDRERSLPELPEAISRLTRPPPELVEQSKAALSKLVAAADVKKVPPRPKGRKREREADKPLSGLDVEALLGKRQKKTLDPTNAVPQYKQALADAADLETIKEATEQFRAIIEKRVSDSFGDQQYERAIEELRTMRGELIEYEMTELYDEVIGGLREKIEKGALNGDRREMLFLIRRNRLGPVAAERASPAQEPDALESRPDE